MSAEFGIEFGPLLAHDTAKTRTHVNLLPHQFYLSFRDTNNPKVTEWWCVGRTSQTLSHTRLTLGVIKAVIPGFSSSITGGGLRLGDLRENISMCLQSPLRLTFAK